MFKFILYGILACLCPLLLFAQEGRISPNQQPTVIKVSPLILNNPKIVSLWLDYLNKLSVCVPGIYTLPQINPATAKQYGDIETDKIFGLENDGRCNMSIMYFAEDDPRLLLPVPETNPVQLNKYPAGLDCKFRASTLGALVGFYKELLDGEEVRVQSDNRLTQGIIQDCSFFVRINGIKIKIS